MSNWQSFKKKHVLLMNAAFTVAIPAAVWLIMELLNLAFCGVHTLNSTVDYTTLMRNLVTSFCFALGLNCNLPVGRMDTSTGSQMYLACIIGGNIALSLNLGGVGVLVFSMLFGMLAGGFVGFLFINMRMHNRERLHSEEDFPMSKTFEDGIDFLNRNGRYDNWFLQIETFDPHEPFTSPTSHFDPDCATQPDWPPYADVTEGPEEVEAMRTKYEASVRFCDRQLGRVLDLMDELDLWKDTMLIVNTDHGFFLSEHGYWGKGGSPNYEELVHTPLFIWDPRSGRKGVHSPALVQTIDLAPTVLDYFGIEIPADMLGRPLTQTLADDTPVREYALFGYHSMPVGITDGRYTLLRDVKDFDEKTYEYTQMPTHMRAMFSVEEMRTATMAPGFSYTKGTPVMKIEARPNPRFLHTLKGGDMLFDLQNDPHQEHVLEDAEQSDRLLTAMTAAFEENDAPEEMYSRYGLKQYRKKAE